MSKRNKAIVVIIFFIGLVFLLFGSPRKIVNGQTCTGGFSCGNWANCCEPASDSSPNCNPGVCDSGMCDSGEGGCTWKTYCDDSFEDNDCTGDSQPACLLSPHCSISACSGPNSVTCNWYIPPPPPPTSTPPPPPPGEDNCYKCEPFCVLYTVPSGTCTTDCNACPGATSTPPPACNTPADPTNLDFNCGWSGTNITITWSDVSDADYFSLRVDNTSANPWDSDCSPINPGDICDDLTKAEANCSGGTCSYTFASDPNANYDWWIHSRVNCSPNVWGNGIHGPLMKCTPNCSITGGGSTITLPGNGLYSAEFESLDGELEGEIFWQRIGFPLTRISYQDFGSATSGSITNASWIPPGVGDYQVCCRAWNDARTECMDSQFSPVPPAYSCVGPDECMNVRVDVLAFCNPPTNLAPTTDRACGTTSVDFSWVETVGCTGYVGTDFELDRDANGVTCGANGDICRNFSAGTTTASSTVGQGYRYRWHMRSRNGAGGGNWGSWVYFDVPPATPSILTTTLDCAADPTLGEGMVAVDWTSATGADTYMLYRCSGASSFRKYCL